MNTKKRSEFLCKIRDIICKYHNEWDSQGMRWYPSVSADVMYAITETSRPDMETILVTITIQDRRDKKPLIMIVLFKDNSFTITRATGWPRKEIYQWLVPRFERFLKKNNQEYAVLT